MAIDQLVRGRSIPLGGYFTKRLFLGDLGNADELERRLGYAPGRLAAGWFVCHMVDRPPRADEFELGGYTHFSNSRERGHTDTPGQSAEEWLRSHHVDVMRQRQAAARVFTLAGAERLTKIVPVLRGGVYWHPDPNPVPQWRLRPGVEMMFLVAEHRTR